MLIPPGAQALLDMAQVEEQKLNHADFTGNPRYTKLLITRAREIAQRCAAEGDKLGLQELELLREFYADTNDGCSDHDLEHWLYTFNLRLASDLRNRRLNSAQQACVLGLLDTQVRARLAITNPKVLNTADPHK